MTRFFCLLAAAAVLLLPEPVASAASTATRTVMMQDYAFTPGSLTVQVGDTVTWMQHDTAPHDVVTTSAPVAFRSPQLSQGESWSYTFRSSGTYAYYCSVHPDMRAQVIVQPAPTPTPTPQPSTRAPVVPPAAKQSTAAPSRTSVAAPPSVSTTPTTSSAAAPVPDESEPPSGNQPAQAVAQPTAQTSSTSLDPMLLVAGLVTAVAIGCLLALTSRQA
ncbi:plastocyanin/azurin family copper-binding protein [Amycolatopsis sp.]|jgi:plastocyanin|uniref:plastocyanin/azurin family copper-binding protein n=1 Tax=Amycolatopsis sp. TaxID=37632 RepID=UPI002E0B37EC|nr:plastocyanin/azurin family copper-binding protein [Amycolatopsis sp.]